VSCSKKDRSYTITCRLTCKVYANSPFASIGPIVKDFFDAMDSTKLNSMSNYGLGVNDAAAPISVPVGIETLGRIMDVLRRVR